MPPRLSLLYVTANAHGFGGIGDGGLLLDSGRHLSTTQPIIGPGGGGGASLLASRVAR
jgi:hypothetical protein